MSKLTRKMLSYSEHTYRIFFVRGLESARWQFGIWKAWRVFEHARVAVPAYKKFLNERVTTVPLSGWTPVLDIIPSMDKESYVKKYTIEERCVDGKIPSRGVMIDESSGTSGSPNNWVRGPKEREAVRFGLHTAVHFAVGNKPIFYIDAFALGPWATGMNVAMSLVDIVMLKTTGPDLSKIINTLKLFGPSYHYVIAGYPPFLKSLCDSEEIDWSQYDIVASFGGEGMSEGMRAYLLRKFKFVYGNYGASDLEINVASENDFTIALRQKIMSHEGLYKKIVRHNSLPMVFQYNSFDYYIETNQGGELLVTLCRMENISPKVRYNIHDLGHVMRLPELERILREEGLSLDDIGLLPTDLPFLFHYGRSDMSVAFFGSKITPSEIEEIVFAHEGIRGDVASFSIITTEDEHANKRLTLALELAQGKEKLSYEGDLAKELFDALRVRNQDFREASKMIPAGFEPGVEVSLFGEGPFAVNDIRLKKHYIQQR